MFLFLSKILPLFFYPLGLACLLLFIALIISWKQLSRSQLPIALALIVLLVSSNGWTQNLLVRSLEGQNLPAELPNADAIVLLGGATKSATKPRPMVDVSEQGDRVLYAAKLYLEKKAPIIIASGGRIDWNSAGQPEAADMAQLLEMMGVPKDAIVQEPDSLNTYQNAVNVKKILDEKGIKRVLLVTSALHMPRSLLIFQRQKIEAIAAPTDFLVSEPEMEIPSSNLGAIVLNLLPDSGRLDITTKVIKEYIGTIIYRLKGWI
jgi:uncharacterized SAM-binding protein YcdF (DUF218 family)